jgi:hypothetical protein
MIRGGPRKSNWRGLANRGKRTELFRNNVFKLGMPFEFLIPPIKIVNGIFIFLLWASYSLLMQNVLPSFTS